MRRFTLEEANALIPEMEMIMQRIQQRGLLLRQTLDSLAEEVGRSGEEARWAEVAARHPELREIDAEIEALVTDIDARGAQFKGLDLGLVDFPAEIDGEAGMLCWQFGEKEIAYWHTCEAGFAGRQPLPRAPRRSYLQ